MPSLFGLPTYAEVDELIAAKSAQIAAVDAAAAKTLPAWSAADPAAAAAWRTAWQAMIARWNAAVALRGAKPSRSTPIPPEVIWGALMHSIRQAWDGAGAIVQSPPETPGDFQPLAAEVTAAGAKPDYSGVPQPVVPDAQLSWFEAAGVVVHAAEAIWDLRGLLVLLAAGYFLRGRD